MYPNVNEKFSSDITKGYYYGPQDYFCPTWDHNHLLLLEWWDPSFYKKEDLLRILKSGNKKTRTILYLSVPGVHVGR